MAIYRFTVRLEWGGSGSPGFNMFHARSDDDFGVAPESFRDLLVDFYTSMATNIYPSGTVITVPDNALDVETREDVPVAPVTVNGGGTGSAAELLQIAIPWRTTSRTRRGSGRTFIGPLTDNVMASTGNPGASQLGIIEGAADTLLQASIDLSGGAFGVYGYLDPPVKDTERPDDAPRVLRDWTSRGQLRSNGFSYLSSRRD